MSDNEDLFGDSSDGGDTDELIASSKAAPKPVATKKKTAKRLQKKASTKKKDRIPDADNDSDDEGAALFDSSDEEGDAPASKTKKKKKQKTPAKKLSKREKMEALKAKRIASQNSGKDESGGTASSDRKSKDRRSSLTPEERKAKGYDSGDSYNSATFERTKEDDDFIDAEGEDPDALRELYAEQHFDDERPSGEDSDEEEDGKRKKKAKAAAAKKRARGPDALSDDGGETDNPIMAAVRKMKKKKKEVKKLDELEQIAQDFLGRMEIAAKEDEAAVKERRPATKKLVMLGEVLDMLTKREMMRPLLEFDLLVVAKRWIQPLPNGTLGNVTVRQKLLDSISKMTGDYGVTSNDLKKSNFGKVVMSLYMHKSETPAMKRQLKALIEQWSRPIFQKSGNMRDLDKVQALRRHDVGLVGIARAQAAYSEQLAASSPAASGKAGNNSKDLASIISTGVKSARDLGNNRVRVPYSKGFQFTVRPSSMTGDVTDKKTRVHGVKEGRGSLHKRMLEKNRPVSKNQRSANISIEGRVTK